MEPGIYPGLPFAQYFALGALNARLISTITERCPAAARYESWLNDSREREAPSKAMDAGSISHELFLEGSTSRAVEIDPNDFPSPTSGAIPEGYTNKPIRARRDEIYAQGKLPILKAAMAEITARVNAANEFVASLEKSAPDVWRAFQPGGGESEVSMLWDDDGTLCKIRPDRINTERTLIVDYKTGGTSAEPDTWGRVQMIRMHYYQAAAFYRRGVHALTGKHCEYVFLVQENEAPYLCSLVGVSEEAFMLGNAQVRHGMDLWRKCMAADRWPAYPSHICYPELPAWEATRWEERETMGNPYDPAQLFGDSVQRMRDAEAV